MRVLWICGLPAEVQREALGGVDHGSTAAWSWIMGHLPPPPGVDLHIACRTARHTAPRTFEYRGATFHLVPVRARARVFCLFRFDWRYFREVVGRVRPEVIHGWGTEDAYSNVALKLAPRTHLVQIQGSLTACRQHVPMHWITALSAWNERSILNRARNVVAENEGSLTLVRPWLRGARTFVVEHPVRADFLNAELTPGTGQQMVFIGALEERKGLWDAIEAFGKGAPAGWRLAIVGAGSADTVARLRSRLAEPGLVGRSEYHPSLAVGGLVQLMRESSVLLLPTWIDTGPTVLKEALSLGLWPVCYDNSGPGHYLRRFHCGQLVANRRVEELTRALREVCHQQPWRDEGFRARVNCEMRPHFSREHIWADLRRVYQDIVARA
jgi:glycosyltransferase involved in cell wall biosynthesis